MTIDTKVLRAIVVPGTHIAHGSYFTIARVYRQSVTAFVGIDGERETNMNVHALRDYAALYAAIADALEGK